MPLNLKNKFERLIPDNYKTAAAQIAEFSEKTGVKAYLIGGIARDLILNNAAKDVDITIEGDAVSFCRALEDENKCRIISVQENLRTAAAEFNSGAVIDFASSRGEYYTASGALPIAQNFGCSLKEDVKRRDFTINTLAIPLFGSEKYKLIDYFGGLSDIKNKKIRVLHEKSFSDDPSRIIRALKFQMRFNFEIEEKTYELMRNYLESFAGGIPLERVKNELKQYFSIEKEGLYENLIEKKAYKLICSSPAAKEICFLPVHAPALKGFIYLSMLFINSDFENEKLNLTADEKKTLREAKELIKNPPAEDNFSIYKAFIDKTEPAPFIYYAITRDKAVLKFLKELKNIKLQITGRDLINLGLKPSPQFKIIFDEILKRKLEGALKTKEEEIKFAAGKRSVDI